MAKLTRGVRHTAWSMRVPKSSQDRMIVKIVKSLLESQSARIFFSPRSSKIYIYTEDKSYTIVFDRYSINITNHTFFFTYSLKEDIGNDLVNSAVERLEKDRISLEEEMIFNEKNFLGDVYDKINKKNKQE